MRDRKAIVIDGNECGFAPGVDPTSSDFPDTLTGLITGVRIDLLSSQAALTLKVASVVGLSFSLQIVRDVHPIGAEQPKIPTYLVEVEHLDFTRLEAGEPDLAYVFRHIVVQEASYSLLLFQQRRLIHVSVAEWYERHSEDLGAIYSILAYHWSRAGDVAKAISYLELATEQALRNYANQEAVTFVSQARKSVEDGQLEIIGARRARWDLFQEKPWSICRGMEKAGAISSWGCQRWGSRSLCRTQLASARFSSRWRARWHTERGPATLSAEGSLIAIVCSKWSEPRRDEAKSTISRMTGFGRSTPSCKASTPLRPLALRRSWRKAMRRLVSCLARPEFIALRRNTCAAL